MVHKSKKSFDCQSNQNDIINELVVMKFWNWEVVSLLLRMQVTIDLLRAYFSKLNKEKCSVCFCGPATKHHTITYTYIRMYAFRIPVGKICQKNLPKISLKECVFVNSALKIIHSYRLIFGKFAHWDLIRP